jgi:hypothetical protein
VLQLDWCINMVSDVCYISVNLGSQKKKVDPVIQVVLVGMWETCSVLSHIH